MAATLEEALAQLDEIFDVTRRAGTRLGLFPAMYRQVTRAIHSAVSDGGLFEDDERVEHLAAIFAGRYLDAFHSYRQGGPTPACWSIAFETAEDPRQRMIIQHLLLGMNAHINLDLGISAADVGGSGIDSLRADFDRVNEILFLLVDRLQDGLSEVSPRMAMIDRVGRSWDEALMRVGIRRARAMAWPFAVELAGLDEERRVTAIVERDEDAHQIGRLVAGRWSPINILGRLVANAEVAGVPEVMDALAAVEIPPHDAGIPNPPEPGDSSRLLDALPRRHRTRVAINRRRGSTSRPS